MVEANANVMHRLKKMVKQKLAQNARRMLEKMLLRKPTQKRRRLESL